MEAMVPLASLLDQADKKDFTLKEAIPMIQSAIVLLGDAVQHQSSLSRTELMKASQSSAAVLDEGLRFQKCPTIFVWGRTLVKRPRPSWK